MRETATLIGIGLLAAGVLGSTSVALACDKSSRVTESTCSAVNVVVAVPAASTTAASATAATAAATPGAAAPGTPATRAEAGMRAYIDPETGTIGGPGPLPPPSDEAVKALESAVQQEPVETVLPDGSVMLDLKGRGQEYFILQLDADGRRVARCVEDPNSALQTPPPVKREER
jgi:hypothetical protein